MSSKVVAIVGSYRKGGTVDTAVDAVLAGAREHGAETGRFISSISTLNTATTVEAARRHRARHVASARSRTMYPESCRGRCG